MLVENPRDTKKSKSSSRELTFGKKTQRDKSPPKQASAVRRILAVVINIVIFSLLGNLLQLLDIDTYLALALVFFSLQLLTMYIRGQSLGKLVMGIRVVQPVSYQSLSFEEYVKREIREWWRISVAIFSLTMPVTWIALVVALFKREMYHLFDDTTWVIKVR